jgi:hypothetical protein
MLVFMKRVALCRGMKKYHIFILNKFWQANDDENSPFYFKIIIDR